MTTNFSIKASLDASGFKSGTDQMSDGLDTASQAMADLERADLSNVQDSIEDVVDEVDNLEKKFRDALDPVENLNKKVKDLDNEKIDIDVDVDKDKRARKQLDDLKKDVAASGNESGQELAGSMASGFSSGNVVEGMVEVLAEATESLSGPFAAAGIAAAVGVALVYAELEKVATAVNDAKTAGGEWAKSFNTQDVEGRLEALREKFDAFATEITDKSEWFEFGEAAETALEQIKDGADKGGASVNEFMKAFNEEDPTRRLELLVAALDKTRSRADDLRDSAESSVFNFGKSWDVANSTRELDEQADSIEGLVDEQRIALETEEAMADAKGVSIEKFREYNQLTDEAKERVDSLSEGQQEAAISAETQAEATEELNDEVSDLAGNARDAARAELDLAEQLEETSEVLKDSKASVRDKKNAVLDEIDAVLASAEANEEATGSVKGFNDVLDKNMDQLYRDGKAAGYTKGEIDKLTGGVKRVPNSKEIDISTPGYRTAKGNLDDIADAARDRQMEVNVRANTRQANSDVANFRYRQSSIPVTLQLRAV